jgi:broad specificity phosphatase PhoE
LIDLLRHGDVQGGPCFRGWQDDPLSAEGWAQLEAAIAFAGPSQRAGSVLQRQPHVPGAEGKAHLGRVQDVHWDAREQPNPPSVEGHTHSPEAGAPAQADEFLDAAEVSPLSPETLPLPLPEAETPVRSAAGRGTWDRILCSPLQRCAAFALALGERARIEVEPLDAFRERGFGVWEGKRADEIEPDALARFWTDPAGYDPPDAEPFAEFRQRVIDGWQRLVDEGAERSLVITHGGVIRVILGEILGLPDDRLILIEVPHACRTRLRVPHGAGHPSLISHGEAISG